MPELETQVKPSGMGLQVRPYSKRGGWKDGGQPRDGEIGPAKTAKVTAKNKWYLGIDGLVHIVTIGKYSKVTEICAFKPDEGTREQDELLSVATEDQGLVG